MEVNGTTQNSDGSNFSGNQTLEPSDDQGSMMVSDESQNVSGDSAFSVSNPSSNVNNTLNSEPNVSNVLNESGSLNTDALLIQSPKLLRNANVASPSSSTKSTTDNNNDNSSKIGGSFLKNLFEINGPASRSINELLKEYPYLPYYSLFSLLTASTGRESVERMLEWMRQLQAKQVATTEGLIKSKEYNTEKQFSDAYKSDDNNIQANARAGISPSGGPSNVDTSNKCVKAIIAGVVILAAVAVAVFTYGAASGASLALSSSAIAALTAGAFVATATLLMLVSFLLGNLVNAMSKDPATRAKLKGYFDLLNPINAAAEIIVMIAELFTDDEAKLQKIRLIFRIIFAVIFAVLAIFSAWYMPTCVVPAIIAAIVAASGLISGIIQIAQAAYNLSTLKKQKKVAEQRLEFDTAIAYFEKLQKDLDIISSEIDMLVEFFTAAMDKIRAEYDRISRMIKETSDVKNMIARNIGA